MAKNHLKSIAAPKTWKIDRKASIFVMKQNPGRLMKLSLPLGLALKEFLKIAKTNAEAKKILQLKTINVNGKKRTDLQYPIGLLEVVEIKETNEKYRLSFSDTGFLQFVPIKDNESGIVPLKILGKKKTKGKTQLNLFNGMNVLVDNDSYKTNDSVIVDLKDKKIKTHIPMKENSRIIMIAGKNTGKKGTIESVSGNKVKVKTKDGSFETITKNIFVIGDDKAEITV